MSAAAAAAAALSNLTIPLSFLPPLTSHNGTARIPNNNGTTTMCCVAKGNKNNIRSEARENLDHLQRAGNKQQHATQQTPKKKIPQSYPLGLWDRFPSARTIQQMIDTMDGIMDDPFAYAAQRSPLSSPNPEDGGAMQGNYRRGRTPWEIKEKENEYKLRFDVPGMTRSDVKVWVEEKMMVIKAEKAAKGEQQQEEEDEWPAGSFGRYHTRIALPENVEIEKIKAEVKDGVLYITIPKVQASAKVLDIDVR